MFTNLQGIDWDEASGLRMCNISGVATVDAKLIY